MTIGRGEQDSSSTRQFTDTGFVDRFSHPMPTYICAMTAEPVKPVLEQN